MTDEGEGLLACPNASPRLPGAFLASRMGRHAVNAGALIRGDALTIPLADASVDLIVSSPPYFALRSYRDDGEHYDGQIGSEPTPADFLCALWSVMDECHRVLKPSGSAFIDLGDKYAGSGGHNNTGLAGSSGPPPARLDGATRRDAPDRYNQWTDTRRKSLMGLPWRFALGCTIPDPYRTAYHPDGDHPVWILRAEIVHSKPNSLPESVVDRVRRSHEQWFHLTREPRYFSAVDEIREPQKEPERTGTADSGTKRRTHAECDNRGFGLDGEHVRDYNPLGKLPGSVWSIPSEPLQVPDHIGVDHFASFPTEFPRRLILGWSPSGICVACGEGRRPVVDTSYELTQVTNNPYRGDGYEPMHEQTGRGHGRVLGSAGGRAAAATEITGYECACPDTAADTRPAVILDPFVGTGTVVLVARALGRYGVGVDLSADYLRLATWRVWESGHGAKALRRTNLEKQTALDLNYAPALDPDDLDYDRTTGLAMRSIVPAACYL